MLFYRDALRLQTRRHSVSHMMRRLMARQTVSVPKQVLKAISYFPNNKPVSHRKLNQSQMTKRGHSGQVTVRQPRGSRERMHIIIRYVTRYFNLNLHFESIPVRWKNLA